MISETLRWGVLAFLVQLLISVFLPRYIISSSDAAVYGQLSLFFWLLLPSLWIDFSSNLNAGLIARLQSINSSEYVAEIMKQCASDSLFWMLLWTGLVTGACLTGQNLFSAAELILLAFLAFGIPYGLRLIWWQFAQRRFSATFVLQIVLSSGWVAAILAFSIRAPIQKSVLWASIIMVAFLILWCRHQSTGLVSLELSLRQHFRRIKESFYFKLLFFLQAVLHLLAVQVDRYLIAGILNWDSVAYYIIPIGILFKFPAVIAFFVKPLLSQLSTWRHQHNSTAIRLSFIAIMLGSVYFGTVVLIPISIYFIPFVGLWINPIFAIKAFSVAKIIIWLLPPAIWMMLSQSFLVGLGKAKHYNLAAMAICLAHWSLLYIGGIRNGISGIGWGFLAEASGGLILMLYTAGQVLNKQDCLGFIWKLVLALLFWGASIGFVSHYGFLVDLDYSRILPILVLQTCFGLAGLWFFWRLQKRFSRVF